MRVENDGDKPAQRGDRLRRSPTRRATATGRCSSAPVNIVRLPRRRAVQPTEHPPGARQPVRPGLHPGRAAALQDPDAQPREPPARARDPHARRARRGRDGRPRRLAPARRRPQAASALLEAGREDLARGRRGGRPAGARADEQDAHGDPRTRRCPPGVGREPRVGVASGRRAAGGGHASGFAGSGSQRVVRLELGGAGLAGDLRRPASPPPCRCPPRTTASISRSTVRAVRARVARTVARRVRRRRSRASAAGAGRAGRSSRRRSPSAARVACTRALADRRRADREVVADLLGRAGSCSSPRPGRRGRG